MLRLHRPVGQKRQKPQRRPDRRSGDHQQPVHFAASRPTYRAALSSAPGSAAQFLSSAAASHQAGYRVELVLLGVRAADSRQGTAAHYAEVSRNGLPARFTTADGHDVCFRAVADAAVAGRPPCGATPEEAAGSPGGRL
ncbi:zeta toxin family protein [Streptomyces lunaelactis]|nr:zeta toxin family protein [Streptomyces lunaelactis]NUK85965.1 zeta toxin family protein [Streptomyces lunaelactis]